MIDREGFNELVARDRVMFHLLWDADAVKIASVLEHGLERVASNYPDFWESRTNHVYFGRLPAVKKIFLDNVPDGRAYVNGRGLADWALFSNRNEDHFQYYESEAARKATQRFGLPLSPAKWIWDWAKYLGTSIPSLGEWAEAVDLGSDPLMTRYSADRGSLAYQGVIPPAAVRFVKSNIS